MIDFLYVKDQLQNITYSQSPLMIVKTDIHKTWPWSETSHDFTYIVNPRRYTQDKPLILED